MSYSTLARAAFGALFVLLLHIAPAQAQAPRFVATTGSDANLCATPATACRTFQRAHDVAAPGDQIVALDADDFQSVVITKSISIVAAGVHATLFAGSTTKIVINAGADDVVYLDGLAIGRNAITDDNSGIEFNSGARLHVRNSVIRNFSTAGIEIKGGGTKRVFVSDSTIANNTNGVWARGGGTNFVFLDRVTVEGNENGVRANGSGARIRLNNSTITGNDRGIVAAGGGRLISFGNNVINHNGIDGEPTNTVALK
jgi:hypothetical protein